MKKVFSILLCITLLLTSLLSVNAANLDSIEITFEEISRFQLGDINADTYVNASDITQLRKNFLSSDEIEYNNVSDLNCDNIVDIRDLVRFKKKLSGIITSYFDNEANELKSTILNSVDGDVSNRTGKTLYVSSNGTSGFSNNSASNPCSWDNFLKWNGATSGSAASLTTVLFKRGDTFRGEFIAYDGYYYGAYGEGAKPVIYGSRNNYSTVEWTLENGFYTLTLSHDVGNIFLNDGQFTGVKKSSLEEVAQDFDFYNEAVTSDDVTTYKLYLKLSKAPAEYDNIEIGINRSIIYISQGTSNVTIDNLSLKYSGAHGIHCIENNNNIIIRDCEVSYIGGSYITGYKDGTVRYGNGIEFWRGCKSVSVENCYIHDIYDSGITHQGDGSYAAINISFKGNIIERCGMGSIEYWLSYLNEDYNYAENVIYADNIMRFVGYGFGGEQRPDKDSSAHIQSNGNNQNGIENFVISGNIFDISASELINIVSLESKYPTMSDNTYAQVTGELLGTYSNSKSITYDALADDYIENIFNDDNASVYWY